MGLRALHRNATPARRGPDATRSTWSRWTARTTSSTALFDAMQSAGGFERAIFIIHGDHGSRLDRGPHARTNEWDLTGPDMMDAYSTLFAVKLPGEVGAYDRRVLSLEQLLEHVVHRGTTRGERALSAKAKSPSSTCKLELRQRWRVAISRSSPTESYPPRSRNCAAWRKANRRSRTISRLGLAYFRNRLYAEALEANTKAVALGPEDPIAYNNLCSTHIALQVLR